MPISNARIETIPTGGHAYTIDAAIVQDTYIYDGSGVLSASVTISPAAIATTGIPYTVVVDYRANLTVGTHTVTIFGYQLTEAEAKVGRSSFLCRYINDAWLPPIVTNSNSNVTGELGKTIVVDSTLGVDATGLRESLDFRFKTLDAALAVAQTNDMLWMINGSYTQTVPFTKNISIRCEPLATINFGDAFDNSLYSVHITGSGILSCNNIGTTISTGVNHWIECYSFTFKTFNIPTNGFGSQNEFRLKASEYVICYTNISIRDNISIYFTIDTPQLYFFNLYNANPVIAVDIRNLTANSKVLIDGEIVEDIQNVGYKYQNIVYCLKDTNADFDVIVDKVTVKNGVTDTIIFGNDNVAAYPNAKKFLVKDIINHLGTTGSVVKSFNRGIVEMKGDVYVSQSNNMLAIADTDANIASTIYFEDSNLYYQGTAYNICALKNTNSRISFKNTKIISSTAGNDVYGIVAGSKYQALSLYSNRVQGLNCTNEISAGFVVRDSLII